MHGERSITPNTALRLGQYFGQTAQCWLNLQTNYYLNCAHYPGLHGPPVHSSRYLN